MFWKNNVQKNFKKQMKELETELKQKEKEESGAFTNTFYKQRFYGFSNSDSKVLTFNKVMRFIFSPFKIILAIIAIVSFVGTFNNTENDMISAYEKGNYDEAIIYSDKILAKNESDYNALIYKSWSLTSLGNFEEAVENLKRAKTVDSDIDLYFELGYNLYELNEYDEAIPNFDKVIKMDSHYTDAYMFKGYSLVGLGKYDEALECADELETIDKDNAYSYNIRGLVSVHNEDYDEGIENFNKAIEFFDVEDNKFEAAYTNTAWALFSQKNYSECIEFCSSIKDYFPDNYDIPYYIGDCYSVLSEHEKAISAYEDANKLFPDDHFLLSYIGWEYYYLEDYDKASQYAKEALTINSENYMAQDLDEMVKEAQKPESERIANFVKQNYLYFDQVNDFEQKAAKFMEKNEVSQLEIYEFLESVRLKDDIFTFFIFDQYYDEMIEEELNNQIQHKALSDNVQYIKINSFTTGIDEQFRKEVKKIAKPEEQILVIDLVDNPGGLSNAANNVLDILLPECVTSYTVDRNGDMSSYSSDSAKIAFKHIYIYVNEGSASSSELIALGLKTYLKEVTVIGRPTVGKGVGQTVLENKKEKYIIFLVNHYWNIKQKNVSDQKIQPDILVKGNELSDYINEMNRNISGKK